MSHAGREHQAWKKNKKKTQKEIEAFNTVPSRQSSDRSAGQTSRLATLKKLFPGSSISREDFDWALKHGDNGICLGLIFQKNLDPQKEDFLNLFTFDEDASFFSRGGFGKDSFKVKFLGKLIRANFHDCKTDADRKLVIKTKLQEMAAATESSDELKATLVDILNSKTFKTPAPKTSMTWLCCFKKSPVAPASDAAAAAAARKAC